MKFVLFTIKGFPSYNEKYILKRIVNQIAQTRISCKYEFDIPLPDDLVVDETRQMEKVKRVFGQGYKQVKVSYFTYYLIFDHKLDERELGLWRMFKMGWLANESR